MDPYPFKVSVRHNRVGVDATGREVRVPIDQTALFWCNEQFGYDSWALDNQCNLCFQREQDLTMFMLRWC